MADGGEEVGGGEGNVALADIDEAGFAEFLVAGVHSFGKSVGEEDKAIAGFEARFRIGVRNFLFGSKMALIIYLSRASPIVCDNFLTDRP